MLHNLVTNDLEGFTMSLNRTARTAITLLLAALAITMASAAFAADAGKPVIQVGSMTLDENEVLQVLGSSAGGNPMMVGMMLAQATSKDRLEMANQIADALVFAEAAKKAGTDKNPDTAFKIKWQTIQTLVEGYLGELGKKLEVNDKTMKKYYDAHKTEFVQAPASHIYHILCETEEDAKAAIQEIDKTKDFAKVATDKSKDPNSAPGGGDLGWVEKGTLDKDVETAVEGAKLNTVIGPVKSAYGWHVLKVTELRPQKQLSYDEAQQEVSQRMQRNFIDEQLKEAKKTISVKIDENVLDNLGGMAAPTGDAQEQKTDAPKK